MQKTKEQKCSYMTSWRYETNFYLTQNPLGVSKKKKK